MICLLIDFFAYAFKKTADVISIYGQVQYMALQGQSTIWFSQELDLPGRQSQGRSTYLGRKVRQG
jgi:hypothetical protein